MSSTNFVPPEFEHLVELASDSLGGFVLFATDEFFAAKDNLLKHGDPVFDPNAYTDRGKLMDGWESQRMRSTGHDYAIVRLGVAGRVRGVLVDTTHFRGNAPTECALEGIEASVFSTVEALSGDAGYSELLPRTKVLANSRNVFAIASDKRVTHVRLRIYPDGGVARLRVYGDAVPDESVFWQPAAVDLVAVENGGKVSAVSDRFFGPPSNLLLPGRGVNMGDGWETARRRSPGSDWAVLELARPAVVERVEVDTHFFKGNAPQSFEVEAVDARAWSEERKASQWASNEGWTRLVGRTPLERHWRHAMLPDRPRVVTHLRCHIYPHGGVNRMRVYGRALDLPAHSARLAHFAQLSDSEAQHAVLAWNGSREFAEMLAAQRASFTAVSELLRAADALWWTLSEASQLEAFAAHPRLGQSKKAESANAQSASWSSHEQAMLQSARQDNLRLMEERNEQYFAKFGFIFILCATGASPQFVLDNLEQRLDRSRAEELEAAAREQAKITRIRISKWIQGGA